MIETCQNKFLEAQGRMRHQAQEHAQQMAKEYYDEGTKAIQAARGLYAHELGILGWATHAANNHRQRQADGTNRSGWERPRKIHITKTNTYLLQQIGATGRNAAQVSDKDGRNN